jgi:sugar O-acyltransferase (sialic acid O-acetyltransferase NeuD family)
MVMIPLQSAVYILGSGGFANEIATYVREMVSASKPQATYRGPIGPLSDRLKTNLDIFFVDDNAAGDQILSVKEYRRKFSSSSAKPRFSIMGSGQCTIKKKMQGEILEPYISFKHPKSAISTSAKIGKGSMIAPGAVVAARTVLGQHVLANYNCKIGHDSSIGELSTVSPGAFIGGFCKIGDAVYIGANAAIREGITIGDNSIIAMGAIVVKDVPPDSIAIGNPGQICSISEWERVKKYK